MLFKKNNADVNNTAKAANTEKTSMEKIDTEKTKTNTDKAKTKREKMKSLKSGGYSFAVAAIVIAIAVFANIFAGSLPDSITKIDVTSNGMYSISAQTESIVSALEDDITIYWIVQTGKEDESVKTLLGRYTAVGDKITVVKIDPDAKPTFASQYTSDAIYNNSLVVESGSRSKYVSYTDIYTYDYSSYYTTGSYSVNFSGENALTSAIDYVASASVPVLYTLTGHGEAELNSTYETAISADNTEIKTLTLITENAVPEDASCVLINAPQNDISEEELEILKTWMSKGGSVILITDPLESGKTRPNLDALAAEFGMSEEEGIVVEGNANNYAYGMPYYLLPDYGSHDITSPLSSAGYYVLTPIAHALELDESSNAKALLKTSADAYIKLAGYEMETFEKEEGDLEGQYVLAAICENQVNLTEADGSESTGKSCFIWIASASVMDEMTNIRVAGGNEDLFLNCLSYICGEESSISIRAKTLTYDYLTMSATTSSAIKAIIVVLIPAAFLFAGIAIKIRRKHR